jgi:lambda family phage portal protein
VAASILDATGRPMQRTAMRPTNYIPGGMDAGQVGRRLRALPTATRAINSQIRMYGSTVVARSRYLALNNSYAAMAREAYVSSLVGSGITPSPQYKDKSIQSGLKDAWDIFVDEADADWITNFYGMQTLIAGEMFEAGECFVRLRPRLPDDGLHVPFQLQLLPSEMCPVGKNADLGGGNRIECGIEFNAIGQRMAYHFYRNHPGSEQLFNRTDSQMTVVPADEVIHLFKPIRAGQIRGIPHTLSSIATLAMLDLYDDAELERKRIAALFTAFITRPAPDAEDPVFGANQPLLPPDASAVPQGTVQSEVPVLEPGATVELDPGETVEFAEPADVGQQYEPFQYRNLLRAAAGFGTPYAEMTGDLKQANYGSIRAGLITFRRRISAAQKQVMVYQLCRPVWQRFLQEVVLAQVVPALTPLLYSTDRRALEKVNWVPPAWEWIDPYRDLMAEQVAVNNRFKARSRTVEEQGYDKEDEDELIAEDQERLLSRGVSLVQPTPAKEGEAVMAADAAAAAADAAAAASANAGTNTDTSLGGEAQGGQNDA